MRRNTKLKQKPSTSLRSQLDVLAYSGFADYWSWKEMPVESRFVPISSEAPDFTLPSVSGKDVTLSDYRDKRHVVLVFLRGFM